MKFELHINNLIYYFHDVMFFECGCNPISRFNEAFLKLIGCTLRISEQDTYKTLILLQIDNHCIQQFFVMVGAVFPKHYTGQSAIFQVFDFNFN